MMCEEMGRNSQNSVFEKVFLPLIGLPCWQVKRGYAAFLSMEFGEPHLRIREPRKSRSKSPMVIKNAKRRRIWLRGDWHLWIYSSYWEVYANGKFIGEPNMSEDTMGRVVEELDGQILTSVAILKDEVKTIFEFDLGGRLEVSPDDDEEEIDDLWILFEPSGMVLVMRSDGEFSYHPGDQTDNEIWPLLKDIVIEK